MIDYNTISVAGKGLAELPIPFWIRVVRFGLLLLLTALILACAFAVSGWSWVTDAEAEGLSTGFALWCATVATLAVAAPIAAARTGFADRIFNIRRNTENKRVFGGFRGPARPLAIVTLPLALGLTTAALVREIIRTCPLPEQLAKLRIEAPVVRPQQRLAPVYFWDYATWLDPAWLDGVNFVVPYEKGPPRKLLSKVFFEDAASGKIILELHGKRPRSYDPAEVLSLFDSDVIHPRDWPLLWRLQREAGLTYEGLVAPVLYLIRMQGEGTSRVTQAVGVPWSASTRATRPESGRFFFWGPDGGVYQVKCPGDCRLAKLLEHTQFPEDPRGSHRERLEWTKTALKQALLNFEDTSHDPGEKRRRENLLTLYLVSMLTLDPRDPEAFFHLGKLARNRTTATAALRYGRDLGLEHPKLLELQTIADRDFSKTDEN